MKSRLVLLTAFLVILVAIASSWASNRFNVFSYSDHKETVNQFQFYTWLNEFKVSSFQTYVPDSAGRYLMDSLGDTVSLYTQHWRDTIFISDDSSIQLFDGIYSGKNQKLFARFGSMNATNTEVKHGYLNSSTIGISESDDERSVLKGIDTVHSAGLLHDKFDLGIFQNIGHGPKIGSEVYFAASMRLPDTTGADNIVVAQLILDDHRMNDANWEDCKLDTTNPYSVARLNDTLLIVGTATGLDTVPTIDRTARIDTLDIYTGFCADLSSYLDSSGYPFNICYEYDNGTTIDTICSIPYRFIKDITIGDFATDTGYYVCSTKCVIGGNWARSYDYKVYWTDTKTLYLDSLFLYNDNGVKYDSLVREHLSEITTNIKNYYDSHPYSKGNITGLYALDEASGMDMQLVELVRKIADGVSLLGSDYPGDYLATLGAYNNPEIDDLSGQYYDTYLNYADRDFFMFDYYQFYCQFTSSSEEPDMDINVQTTIERYANELSLAKTRADATQSEYWITLPVWDDWVLSEDETTYIKRIRKPTPFEIRALVNLSLSYGAKGIGYWKFVGTGIPDPQQHWYKKREDTYYALNGEGVDDFTEIDEELSIYGACSTSTTIPYWGAGALTKIDPATKIVTKTDLFDSIVVINTYLDSMAYFFNDATWKSAGRWSGDVANMSGSFIDSIETLATYDSAYIQVSFFNYQSEDYAYLVNRRVDDGTYDGLDSQTVAVYMSGTGAYEVWDIYENTCDTIWDSLGIVFWEHFLEPGGAVLTKKVTIRETWSGTVDTSDIAWDWPEYSTINIVGDVTVDSGLTWTIEDGPVISFKQFDDEESSGTNTGLIEIIVEGELRIEGAPNSNAILDNQDIDSVGGWYGIRPVGDGHVYLYFAEIRHAYAGLDILYETYDTVKYTVFDSCMMYGIYNRSNYLILENSSFSNIVDGYGVRLYIAGVNLEIDACDFYEVKYPIYTDRSSPTIEDCSFDAETRFVTAAITSKSSTVTVTTCDIVNYYYGIKNERNTSMTIESTVFNSESDSMAYTYATYMVVGVQHDGGLSSCDVRGSCFKLIKAVGFYQATLTSADLGTSSDHGENSFFRDTTVANCIPNQYVNNANPNQLSAVGNYWQYYSPSTCSGPFAGNIDISDPETFPFAQCVESGGGQKVLTEQDEELNLPLEFSVSNNYPNPFNPTTTIEFALSEASHTTVTVFNVLGQKVKTLLDRYLEPGVHSIVWDGKPANGSEISTGVYLFKIEAGENSATRKMMMIK